MSNSNRRLKTPINNPLSYAKAVDLIRQANRRLRFVTTMWSEALDRETKARDELKAMTADRDDRKNEIAALLVVNRGLQLGKDAMPVAGEHSPLVMQLVDQVLGQGNASFENNDNGADRMRCPHCYSWSYIRYVNQQPEYQPIEHDKDCAYELAIAIRDSQPENQVNV